MNIEWTGGDPDQMAEMGVIGDSPYVGEPEDDSEQSAGEEEWV